MSDDVVLSDLEIMQRIASKDSKSLELLYDRYAPILYTLIYKIIGRKSSSEDCLADVFIIIWKKHGMFNIKTENVYSWLITLARNKAIDDKKRIIGQSLEEYTEEYENEKIIPDLSEAIDPLDLNTALDIRGNVSKAFQSLTDAQRYVIGLAYYEGLTESEIAQRLNIPLQTVQSKIKIALNNLKNLVRGTAQ